MFCSLIVKYDTHRLESGPCAANGLAGGFFHSSRSCSWLASVPLETWCWGAGDLINKSKRNLKQLITSKSLNGNDWCKSTKLMKRLAIVEKALFLPFRFYLFRLGRFTVGSLRAFRAGGTRARRATTAVRLGLPIIISIIATKQI